ALASVSLQAKGTALAGVPPGELVSAQCPNRPRCETRSIGLAGNGGRQKERSANRGHSPARGCLECRDGTRHRNPQMQRGFHTTQGHVDPRKSRMPRLSGVAKESGCRSPRNRMVEETGSHAHFRLRRKGGRLTTVAGQAIVSCCRRAEA